VSYIYETPNYSLLTLACFVVSMILSRKLSKSENKNKPNIKKKKND